MIKNHTDLLNYLAKKYNLISYLEIGVQNPANNYDKIKCLNKSGCDPEPASLSIGIFRVCSDDYFKLFPKDIRSELIFIDGLHHEDQVKRDFDNSLKCLMPGGFIVIHDTLPENEPGTHVPRETKMWWGDVYKFAMKLGRYEGINFVTFDIDNGCTVVWKGEGVQQAYDGGYSWEDFQKHKDQLLRINSIKDIDVLLP
mgnify:CR=1 FL=1